MDGLVFHRKGLHETLVVLAGRAQNLEEQGNVGADSKAMTMLKILMALGYYREVLVAVGVFALNVANPTSLEFMSSLFYANSGSFNLLIVLISSLIQAYLVLCFSAIMAIWVGHCFFLSFSLAEFLRAQT